MDDEIIEFPAFRTDEWINSNRRILAPKQFMHNIEIVPKFMQKNLNIEINRTRMEEVKQDIKNSLFKQSLMQVQNIEVISYKRCKRDRILKKIHNLHSRPIISGIFCKLRDREILEREIWEIDRCGEIMKYKVTLYKEGEDGFSSFIRPCALRGLYEMFKFYYL